jgi:hypothetical protein
MKLYTGSSNLTYVDITNGCKEVAYDVREDLELTVAQTLKTRLKHDDNGRFAKDSLESILVILQSLLQFFLVHMLGQIFQQHYLLYL